VRVCVSMCMAVHPQAYTEYSRSISDKCGEGTPEGKEMEASLMDLEKKYGKVGSS